MLFLILLLTVIGSINSYLVPTTKSSTESTTPTFSHATYTPRYKPVQEILTFEDLDRAYIAGNGMVVVEELSPYGECMNKKKEPISFMHRFYCLFNYKRDMLEALFNNMYLDDV